MSKWLREPLIHFLLLGAMIFIGYQLAGGDGGGEKSIVVSRGQQDNLINTFERTWQRAPTPEEFKGLVDDYVRQEIAFREGMAMGLDEDDIIIRRRMRQKLELLTEDLAALTPPGDQELQQFLAAHIEDYRLEPAVNLRQVYFTADSRDDGTRVVQALQQLDSDPANVAWEQMGDPIPLPAELRAASTSELASTFGSQFAAAVEAAPRGKWTGPIESGFGVHLVFVETVADSRLPALDEVYDIVQRDWLADRRRLAVDELYSRLAERYRIEIEPRAGAGATP